MPILLISSWQYGFKICSGSVNIEGKGEFIRAERSLTKVLFILGRVHTLEGIRKR